MAKDRNPNSKNNSDAYPGRINPESIRSKNDPDSGTLKQHESDLARLDRMHPVEKGGRGK